MFLGACLTGSCFHWVYSVTFYLRRRRRENADLQFIFALPISLLSFYSRFSTWVLQFTSFYFSRCSLLRRPLMFFPLTASVCRHRRFVKSLNVCFACLWDDAKSLITLIKSWPKSDFHVFSVILSFFRVLGDPGVHSQQSLGKDGVTTLASTRNNGHSRVFQFTSCACSWTVGRSRRTQREETIDNSDNSPWSRIEPATFLEEQTSPSLWLAQRNCLAVKCEPLMFFKKEKRKRK